MGETYNTLRGPPPFYWIGLRLTTLIRPKFQKSLSVCFTSMQTLERMSNMKTRTHNQQLTESVVQSGNFDIDLEAGVIRGVRVLGLKSKNGRRYLKEAVRDAMPLYENAKIFIDHSMVEGDRPVRDRWAQLKGVRQDEDGGLSGDLHYLKNHSLTAVIIEAIQRFGDFGLSHDANGEVKSERGEPVVHKINRVHSVDLVSNPATNRTLFESEKMKRKIVEVLLENEKVGIAGYLAKRLKEMDGMGDMTMDAPAEASSPEDQADAAFKAIVLAILDGEGDANAMVEKIRKLLEVKSEISGGGEKTMPETKPPADTAAQESIDRLKADLDKSNKTVNELKESLKLKDDREAAKKMLEAAERDVTEQRVGIIVKLPEAERKAYVDDLPIKRKRPDSSPSRVTESAGGSDADPKVESHDSLKKLLGVG